MAVLTFGMSKGNFFHQLVDSKSTASSKNFFLVCTTLIGMILLLVPAVILCVEVWYNHTITTDLSGLAQYIAAVASVFATAGLTKAWGDRNNTKNDDTQNNVDENDFEQSDSESI